MYIIDTFEVEGLKVSIFPDDSPESPRDWSNLGTMVCWHRRYRLGDKTEFTTPQDFQDWERRNDVAIILPLFLYDHSGLRIKVGSFDGLLPQGRAEFDSMQVGYIYVTREVLRKEYSVKRVSKKTLATAQEVLKSEVAVYDQFLSGEVYSFSVENSDGDTLDSCSGFYGLDDCRNEAKRMAKYQAGLLTPTEGATQNENHV